MHAVLSRSVNAWIDHRAGSKGAALAFYALFSIMPILILAIAGAGYFFGAEAAQGEIIAQVEGLVGRNGAQAIQALLADARDPASGLAATMVASVLLLVGATSVFVELKGSLDEMWGIEPPKGLAILVFLRTQLHSFGLVVVLAFLLLVSLVISAALAVLERYAGGTWSSSYDILAILSWVIAFGVIASLFAVIYKVLPDAPLSWRDVWIGACLHCGIVQPWKIYDWPVPGPQRRGLKLWCGRVAHRIVAMGLLFGTDIFLGCGVHQAVCTGVRQSSTDGGND
jgi:membrane protein